MSRDMKGRYYSTWWTYGEHDADELLRFEPDAHDPEDVNFVDVWMGDDLLAEWCDYAEQEDNIWKREIGAMFLKAFRAGYDAGKAARDE